MMLPSHLIETMHAWSRLPDWTTDSDFLYTIIYCMNILSIKLNMQYPTQKWSYFITLEANIWAVHAIASLSHL